MNYFLKIVRETNFFIVSYTSQNQNSGVEPKKLGVIFSKPKLLTKKHGASHD